MKRSEINSAIINAEMLLKEHRIELPPFLHWSPEEWNVKGPEYNEIRDTNLGWDVTDFGTGDFDTCGAVLITIRNGNVHKSEYTKTYTEKLIVMTEGQALPMHFHWNKMEDIINRGGGNCSFRFYLADAEEKRTDSDVLISRDGRNYSVAAGEKIVIEPGESLTLYPYYYHTFFVEEGNGYAILGEVSMCNDDDNDNRFEEPLGRFPAIEEDEKPYRLLCNEYPAAAE